MDIRLKKNFLTVALLTAIGATSVGCHDKDTTTDSAVAETEAPVIAATDIAVLVLDGATSIPLTNDITIEPVGGDELSNLESTDALTVNSGNASFAVKADVDPTTSSFRVAFKVSADGYITTNDSIVVDSTGSTQLVINLVAESAAPEGVSVATADDVEASDTGALAEEIVAAAETTVNGATVKSEITVPATIEVTNDAGEPVTGTLSTTITHYDSSTTEALDSFPGGLNVAIANPTALQDTDGANAVEDDGELTFLSAGFTSVEIKNNDGEEVANFEPPAGSVLTDDEGNVTEIVDAAALPSVTMEIPDTTINPETGNILVPGNGADQDLKIWSFDVDTGAWTFEPESSRLAVITDNDTTDGVLEVSYPVTHLSYWNLDYFRGANSNCTATLGVVSATDGTTYNNTAELNIVADSVGWSHYARYAGDGDLTLFNAPNDVSVVVTITDSASGQQIGEQTIDNLCTAGQNLEITPPENVTTTVVDVTVEAVSSCSNAAAVEAAGLPVPAPTPIEGVRAYFVMTSPQSQLTDIEITGENGQVGFGELLNTVTTESNGQSSTATATYLAFVYDPLTGQWDFERDITLDTFTTNGVKTYDFPQTCAVTTGASSGSGTL